MRGERAFLLAVVVAASAPVFALAQSTPAPALVGTFRSLCLDTGPAGRTAALAAAEKAGWSPVPDAMLAGFAGQLDKPAGRMKSDASGMQFMVLGEQSRSVGGTMIRMRACGVGGGTPDPTAVDALLQAEAGVAKNAQMSSGQQAAWVYVDEGGRHLSLDAANSGAIKAAVRAGTARFLMKQTRPAAQVSPGGLTIIMMAVPTS